MTEISKILRNEVKRQGVIPFAEFMRLALYCPNYGYYEQGPDRIGRAGDFYTSVTVGGLFGALLAFQCAEWLQELPAKPLQIVEVGAHEGQLAADILSWLPQMRPKLAASLEYWIIEPSPRRQAWQKAKLEKFADRVRWFEHFPAQVRGIVLSNELLDAMPVRRFSWDAAKAYWFEWGVALEANTHAARTGGEEGESVESAFSWKKMSPHPQEYAAALTEAGLEFPPDLLAALPDGFTIDIAPEAGEWWGKAALALERGRLLTIDYGFRAEQFLAAERTGGTLRAYRHHHAHSDVLAQPGEQDLTAHVNFTQLERAGEKAGLSTELFLSQERFLSRIAARAWQKDSGFGEWTAARTRQFQVLAHPEHLGRPFSVLVQGRREV